MPFMDAHRSQARVQGTLLHLISIIEDHIPRNVVGLVALILGLGIFMVKSRSTTGRGVAAEAAQKDEERILRLPRYARGWQPDTHLLFTANLQALGALHGADPAPSNDLVCRQPDALFQWCTLPRDCNIGHLNGLVGIPLGLCRVTVATRLCTVLARLLTVHSECWCASAPLAATLSAISLPAYIQRSCCPDHRDHSLAWLLTFTTRIAAEWYSTATQYWCHRSLRGPMGFALPLWAVDTKLSLSETRIKGGLAWREAERLYPGVDLGSGDCFFGARRIASSAEIQRWCEHIGKSRTATPQPQRRSTVSFEKEPPAPSRNMIKQLFLAKSFNVSQELCFTGGSTTSHAAGTSIHSAGTMHRLVFFSRLARWKRCWNFRMSSCGIALTTGPGQNLEERVVADRPALDGAFIHIDVDQPRDPSHRPTRASSCREQRTVHGVVLTFLETSQMLVDDGDAAPFHKKCSIQVGHRTAQRTERMTRDKT